MTARRSLALLLAAAALTAAGCLFSNAPPPRYFAPRSNFLFPDDAAPVAAPRELTVRVRRVRASAYLGQAIVWRVSDVERGLYEQRRWTELPTRYLDRAVVQAIDRTPGVHAVDSGQVPTLDLELVSFDEVVAPDRAAEVGVVASLKAADQRPVFDRLFTAREAIADTDPASTARAMGVALDDVVQQIADQVAASAPAMSKK